MWPQYGEAISRTIEAEAVLTDLYAEVLNQWAPTLHPFVLPSLTAAGEPPPDPDAVTQNSGLLDQLTAELIMAGLASLWSVSLIEAVDGLEIDLPDIDVQIVDRLPLHPKVMRTITRTSELTEGEVNRALDIVEATPSLREARDEFVTSQHTTVSGTIETLVRDKVVMAVRDAETDTKRIAPTQNVSPAPAAPSIPKPAGEPTPTPTPPPVPTVEVVIENQREAAAAVLTPGSEELRDIARQGGYQAAGVQNAAVVEATRYADPLDQLEKCWIATMDGRTRDTHFAADGQRTPLAGTFTVGGARLRFPADPDGPPEEVRNCRCRVGVLATDEELPNEIDRHTERGPGNATVRNRDGSQADEIARRAARGTIRARDDDDGIGRTAAGTPEVTMNGRRGPASPAQLAQAAAAATGTTTLAADTEEQQEAETFRTFTDQPVAFVGIETSDGRMLTTTIEFTVRTPPLPMMWTKQTGYGHMDAFTVGVIESARVEGDKVLASGYMLNTAEADEAFGQASHKVSRPSVDLGAVEWILTDENGKEITEEDWWDLPMDAKVIQTITAAELIGTTLVATPAFGDTMLEFNPERESRDLALVASAAEHFQPRVYAAAMFADPKLTEPTEIQIDDNGRIFGHLACFGACHRSIQSACVIAPHSPSGYRQFLTSPAVRLDNGTRIPVGRLTVGTGHAPDTVSGPVALAHYDNTGTCFALVNVGEDAHGIWVSGVASPWATHQQIEEGLSAPLSGDWRDFGQGLDLIAALAVNTPGFAVRGRDGADGQPVALVASLGPARGKRTPLSANEIGTIVEAAVSRALAAAARKATADDLVAAANVKVGPPPVPKTPRQEVGELLAQAGSLG